jgi:cobalamin synthase
MKHRATASTELNVTVLRLGLAVTATRAPVIGAVHDRIGGYNGDCDGMRCGITVAIRYLLLCYYC